MKNQLGTLLLDARKHHKLDQVELGQLMGLDDATICKLEKGNRPLYADELLTLTLIFQDWFELHTESFMEDLMADLAARVRQLLETTTFNRMETAKKVWFQRLLFRLDTLNGADAT